MTSTLYSWITVEFRAAFFLIFLALLSEGKGQRDKKNDLSPLYQHLPNCVQGDYAKIRKKTEKTAIVCPMIKDEEGFLSEWVAYYQMHGFNHVIIYDDGSIDNGIVELKPWIESGFVTVKSNFTAMVQNMHPTLRNNAFRKSMAIKALLESDCKLEALKLGYDYHISLDMDEYVVPIQDGETVVDEFDRFITTTGRSQYCISKLNFPSTPHTLEPINLLSIEAYQTRMKQSSKMNYYTSVAAKCGYQLTSPDYQNETSAYIAKCCHFHGCQELDFSTDNDVCKRKHAELSYIIAGKGKKWLETLVINHYSRSLEKYALKQKTWKTSTGEHKKGQTSEQAASSYDIPKFLARSVGSHFDDSALRYSCQLREVLANITGEDVYLRPGSFWYKNPEFGKTITDPDKRGRYGRVNAPGYRYPEQNPNNYHGGEHGDIHVDHSEAEKKRLNDAADVMEQTAGGKGKGVISRIGSANDTIQQHILHNINSSMSSHHRNGHQKDNEDGAHGNGSGHSKKKSKKVKHADSNSNSNSTEST